MQPESCRTLPPLPLETLMAQTQGQIDYRIESTLDGQLMDLGIDAQKTFVSLISYVSVQGVSIFYLYS